MTTILCVCVYVCVLSVLFIIYIAPQSCILSMNTSVLVLDLYQHLRLHLYIAQLRYERKIKYKRTSKISLTHTVNQSVMYSIHDDMSCMSSHVYRFDLLQFQAAIVTYACPCTVHVQYMQHKCCLPTTCLPIYVEEGTYLCYTSLEQHPDKDNRERERKRKKEGEGEENGGKAST